MASIALGYLKLQADADLRHHQPKPVVAPSTNVWPQLEDTSPSTVVHLIKQSISILLDIGYLWFCDCEPFSWPSNVSCGHRWSCCTSTSYYSLFTCYGLGCFSLRIKEKRMITTMMIVPMVLSDMLNSLPYKEEEVSWCSFHLKPVSQWNLMY